MKLGYNTNGFAHHDPLDALEIIAELGYRSVAITLDHGCLNPFARDRERQIVDYSRALSRHQLSSVIETGARYLLDPRAKHEPTLVSSDPRKREIRIDFLRRAIDTATEFGSACVSLWSGIARDDAPTDVVFERLVAALRPVLDHADRRRVVIGFEPEPGMFIDTMIRYDELVERLGDPPHFRLTLDVGHLHCLGETPLASYIRRYAARTVNVHIEDMRAGVHEHLMFGDGEIDFHEVLSAFHDVDYRGGVHVELSRHSHDAPRAARQACEFLRGGSDWASFWSAPARQFRRPAH